MAESAAPAAALPPPSSEPDRLPLVTPTRAVCAVLLVGPFVALLWVGSYAGTTPELIGIPFFYWYQLLWVIISAVFTGAAYLLIRREEDRHRAAPTISAAVIDADAGAGPGTDATEGDL